MAYRNRLTERLGLRLPIIQAPMAGGGDTPELVAAVSNGGGLGSIGAAYLTPAAIRQAAGQVRKLTAGPFAVNLFAPVEPGGGGDGAAARRAVEPYYRELGIDMPAVGVQYNFREQLEAVLDSGAAVLSFTFGLLPADVVSRIRAAGVYLIGTATTVAEARLLESQGVDAVVAQGSEAGGHRGTFAADFAASMVGTMALVPEMVDAVSVPVVASGGIADGRGVAAALALGAGAAQLGTTFLLCDEAGISDAYKTAIENGQADQTRVTRAFSGRPARGIVNRFMQEVEASGAILPFPHQNDLTRSLRREASRQGRAEFLSLWAGQGLRLARRQSATACMQRLEAELQATIERFG